MDQKIIKFDNNKIEEHEFHQHKSRISINNIDINKIASNKLLFNKQDFKYFIGYKDAKKNKTFMHIPSRNGYICTE